MTRPTKLPDAEWFHRRGLSALIAALEGEARYVGGAVRDTLLGHAVKDVDIATPLLPEDVMDRLNNADIKVIPTGLEHGTVTAVLPDGPVEITTLRRDVSTDGRRATVAFSDNWEEDATRRDFTINALFADPETLEIFDYFGGLQDLENRQIRFIGSAKARIAEDHLRIMRYFRFVARIGNHKVDVEAYAACREAAQELSKLSPERIADELMKLLGTANPLYAIQEIIDGDIFTHIISEIDTDALAILTKLISREEKLDIGPSPLRRLVALLPKNANIAGDIVRNLRFSKKQQKSIAARLCGERPDRGNIRPLAYRHGKEAARDIALLFAADPDLENCMKALDGWEIPVFPLKGGDLIDAGLTPGPLVSTQLAKIEDAWIAEGFPDETRAREILRQIGTK